MQLHGKSAVIYGANSPTGASVARAFAKEGATVYLAGRTTSRLQPLAREILNAGGAVEVAEVDPLNPDSVSEHLHQIFVKHGSVDISLNMAFLGIEGVTRLCNLTEEQFAAAAFTRVRSNFITMAAAASEMAHQGRGVILASAVPQGTPPDGKLAGPAIGSAAIEALCEQLRNDVGSFGVRVAYLPELPVSGEGLGAQWFRVLQATPGATSPARELAEESGVSRSSASTEPPAGVET